MPVCMIDPRYCFGDNADFAPLSGSGRIGVVRRKDDCPDLRDCLDDPERWLSRAEIVKDSRSTKAGIVRFSDGKQVFIKRFNNRSFSYTLRYMFRQARPFREWTSAWAMEKAGIPTPRPMAAFARYRCSIPGNAYLIRASVMDVVPTLEFFERLKKSPDLAKSYLDTTAAMFAKMHDAGILHGDAKCSNIYIEDCGRGRYSYGVWDLLSCKVYGRPLPARLRHKELSHFAWSYAEISKRSEGEAVEESRIREELIKRCKACSRG